MPKQDSGAVEAAWRAAASALLALALISASAPMFGVGPVTAADLAADPTEMQDKNLPEYTLVQEPEPWTPADVLAAMATASPRARCIVRTEVGGVGYDPYAVGRSGELGPVQLHPRGKLPEFYARGYTDPFDPYQAVDYLDNALQRGQASHWSAVGLGWC